MSAPSAPTLVTITTEALFKAGYPSPSAAQLTRAQGQHMEEIKNDLWTLANNIGKKLKPLQTKGFDITVIGQAQYPVPSDYASDMTVAILWGSITGTAQGGDKGYVTLTSSDTSTQDYMLGKYILITGGAGVDQMSQCVGFNTSTKQADVEPDFAVATDDTSIYMVIEKNTPLVPKPVFKMDDEQYPMNKSEPIYYSPVGNATDGDILLFPPPDKIYGIQFRYYADLMVLDLAGTLMGTLYQRWRNTFTQGVFAKTLQSDAVATDDKRAIAEMQIYRGILQETVMREAYGNDLRDLTATIADGG